MVFCPIAESPIAVYRICNSREAASLCKSVFIILTAPPVYHSEAAGKSCLLILLSDIVIEDTVQIVTLLPGDVEEKIWRWPKGKKHEESCLESHVLNN